VLQQIAITALFALSLDLILGYAGIVVARARGVLRARRRYARVSPPSMAGGARYPG